MDQSGRKSDQEEREGGQIDGRREAFARPLRCAGLCHRPCGLGIFPSFCSMPQEARVTKYLAIVGGLKR